MASVAQKLRITASAEWADTNPNMADMPAGSTHWKVTLRRKGKRLTVPFSMGAALCREPTADDVLECLCSDAGSYENAGGDFEAWCSEYGYDADSRKAERTFKAVETQTKKLRQFLGDDYEKALYAEF